MKSKMGWTTAWLIFFSCLTVQFSQATLQYSEVITNYGSIVEQSQGTLGPEAIFFAYGAESGGLNPPWSEVGVSPGGTYCSHSADPSGVWINTNPTYVRTGSKSLKLYQHAPPKDNPCRRICCRYYGAGVPDEYYLSWWVYFPSADWDKEDGVEWGSNLGGIHQAWGPPSDRNEWFLMIKFFCSPNGNKRLYARASLGKSAASDPLFSEDEWEYWHWSSYYIRSGFMDRWVHFQIYFKYRQSATGAYTIWIDDNVIGSGSGLKTDPRGYPEWETKNCAFSNSQTNAFPTINLYQDYYSPSHYYYTDDVVGSTEKVPEDYGVVYP